MTEKARFYGKYRGTVRNNVDPYRIGRLLVEVPDALGPGMTSWATPCIPIAGTQSGLFTFPAMNAGVWIEFEQGDLDYPIWVGGYWGNAAEVPTDAQTTPPALQTFVLQTQSRNILVLSDTPGIGGFKVTTTTGASITINDIGITIDNGRGAKIELVGPTVNICNNALSIT